MMTTFDPSFKKKTCPACGGTGMKSRSERCPVCNGSGRESSDNYCPECHANLAIDEPHKKGCSFHEVFRPSGKGGKPPLF
ncbi:hypothetical protein [Alteromonas sp. a30]|uniref:hypothetical protein n=1 Tax=Alteromonas sp. a30 TaxID=2730917 RepID=UPI00228085E4|nr:hypothetical protein [Alteromonas sp. a30]MCY7296463.1 hypothetical protein [Alteromonas sp. a30]